MSADITILQPYSEIRSFETPDEFRKYYTNHKDEIDEKTTNQLNREYTITGFKIAKRNIRIIDGKKVGEIHLKPKPENKESSKPKPENKLDYKIIIRGLVEELDQLKEDVDKLKEDTKTKGELLAQIISVINTSTN